MILRKSNNMRHIGKGFICLLVSALLCTSAYAQSYSKPKVRAITAFVRLEHASFQQQIDAALSVLNATREEFQQQGYETETIRIVTQPLGELVAGMSESQALAYLKQIDDRGAKDAFIPSLGPAMMRDSDDPRTMRLL